MFEERLDCLSTLIFFLSIPYCVIVYTNSRLYLNYVSILGLESEKIHL